MPPRLFASPEFDTLRERLSLDGRWQFSYDPDRRGEKDGWYGRGHELPERIAIPGCSQARHYASSRGHVRHTDVAVPEHSRDIMLRHGSMHPSWYKRTFTVPRQWKGHAVHLHIGGVKPAGEFWINDQMIAATVTSRSPVRVDLTRWLRFGETNTLAIRVSWPDIRLDGVLDIWHAWSGLYRSLWIERVPRAWLFDAHVQTKIKPAGATIRLRVRGEALRNLRATCIVNGLNHKKEFKAETKLAISSDAAGSLRIPMPGAQWWSPNEPNLYRATVRLFDGDELLDTINLRFGLRELKVRGFHVLLNDKPIFLRGGCDDRIHPHTVCPPADKAVYLDQIRKAKAYGFNYTKSAVDVFFREYLDAADELGYLVCQEMPFGCGGELREARLHPTRELTDLWREQIGHIIEADRNHPSVAIYSMASELPVNDGKSEAFPVFSRLLPRRVRELNPSALIFDVTASWCPTKRTRHGERITDLIEDDIENADPLAPLNGALSIPDEVSLPFFLHEWNWITQLPDPRNIKRYAKSPLLPLAIPEMVETARNNGLANELPAMVDRSRKLKHALRKDAYELAYEHPKVAGYHGWLIHDVQYCPEGVFNEFWELPEDLPAEEFRTYNADTVLVIDDRDQRCFTFGGPVELGVIAAHFGEAPLTAATLRWTLLDGKRAVSRGATRIGRVPCGARARVPDLRIKPVRGEKPVKLELRVELLEGRRRVAWNHWPLWWFPVAPGAELPGERVSASLQWAQRAFPQIKRSYRAFAPRWGTKVYITHRLQDHMLEWMRDWEGHLLLLTDGVLKEAPFCRYRTVPYNYGTTGNMGTVIADHPALGNFPHEGWCDLPFVTMIEGAYPIDLAPFKPKKINPIIRSIGHHVTMHDKAYMFEARVGKGALLACSLNVQALCHVHPAARYLLYAMVKYLLSESCRPTAELTADELKAARVWS